METFKFKGISSDTMGVVLKDLWEDSKPQQNYEETKIEGRDGSIFTPLSFSAVTKKIDCFLMNADKADAVREWLQGEGEFEMNGRYRKAYVFGEIAFTRISFRKKKFQIPFILAPFWYKKNDSYTSINSGDKVRNEGNYKAAPMIRITGTGKGDITIGDISFSVDLTNYGTVEIDCLEKNENYPKAVRIGWEYPELKPGMNLITFSGAISKVEIMRKDRWLG